VIRLLNPARAWEVTTKKEGSHERIGNGRKGGSNKEKDVKNKKTFACERKMSELKCWHGNDSEGRER